MLTKKATISMYLVNMVMRLINVMHDVGHVVVCNSLVKYVRAPFCICFRVRLIIVPETYRYVNLFHVIRPTPVIQPTKAVTTKLIKVIHFSALGWNIYNIVRNMNVHTCTSVIRCTASHSICCVMAQWTVLMEVMRNIVITLSALGCCTVGVIISACILLISAMELYIVYSQGMTRRCVISQSVQIHAFAKAPPLIVRM